MEQNNLKLKFRIFTELPGYSKSQVSRQHKYPTETLFNISLLTTYLNVWVLMEVLFIYYFPITIATVKLKLLLSLCSFSHFSHRFLPLCFVLIFQLYTDVSFCIYTPLFNSTFPHYHWLQFDLRTVHVINDTLVFFSAFTRIHWYFLRLFILGFHSQLLLSETIQLLMN